MASGVLLLLRTLLAVATLGMTTPAAAAAPSTVATLGAAPPPTMAPNGADCAAAEQCVSGICSDDVCCDRACDGPTDSCAQAGERGTCVALRAPAPPLSRKGVVSIIALLTAVGLFTFSRRRRLGAATTRGRLSGC